MKMLRRILAAVLCVCMISAITSAAFAVEARDTRPPCGYCHVGYRVFTYGAPEHAVTERISCTANSGGYDIVSTVYRMVYVSCSEPYCNHPYSYKEIVSQTLIECHGIV